MHAKGTSSSIGKTRKKNYGVARLHPIKQAKGGSSFSFFFRFHNFEEIWILPRKWVAVGLWGRISFFYGRKGRGRGEERLRSNGGRWRRDEEALTALGE